MSTKAQAGQVGQKQRDIMIGKGTNNPVKSKPLSELDQSYARTTSLGAESLLPTGALSRLHEVFQKELAWQKEVILDIEGKIARIMSIPSMAEKEPSNEIIVMDYATAMEEQIRALNSNNSRLITLREHLGNMI